MTQIFLLIWNSELCSRLQLLLQVFPFWFYLRNLPRCSIWSEIRWVLPSKVVFSLLWFCKFLFFRISDLVLGSMESERLHLSHDKFQSWTVQHMATKSLVSQSSNYLSPEKGLFPPANWPHSPLDCFIPHYIFQCCVQRQLDKIVSFSKIIMHLTQMFET